ncbi:MAG: hypothetical protein ABR588_11200 [Sphingomicrobium sp.]|nr:hypothetical protein [Sphingomonadales bacterium]
MSDTRPEVAFLFNHDAPHQVAHTALIISAMLEIDPDVRISVLSSTAEQEERARHLLPQAEARISFIRLKRGAAARMVRFAALGFAPLRRAALLFDSRKLLDGFDAIIVPETTTALLRTHFWVKRPALIYLPHGAGDRAVGFRAVTSAFDLVLLAGEKVRDRMLEAKIIRADGHAIVGYPKFDTVDLTSKPALFPDGKPVVLYNPHFDPRLSSWWQAGVAVLDWFAGQDRYNLVFAPHVMLFRKQLHASVEHRQLRLRRSIPKRFRGLANLLIDPGSTRSVDMSYTLGADIYLGDASSQVYEFLVRPRPCIFLNPGRLAWRGDPNFAHWNLGQVIESVEELPGALERAPLLQAAYEPLQRQAFAATFSLTGTSSSVRAAQAILDWISAHDHPEPAFPQSG